MKLLDEQVLKVGNGIKHLLSEMTRLPTEDNQPACDADVILSVTGMGPAVSAALLLDSFDIGADYSRTVGVSQSEDMIE